MSFTIAIDGPAAAGKGTLARALAAHYGYAYLDTGLLYRAVGARMLAGDEPAAAARSLDPADLDPTILRTQTVAEAASQVAVLPAVRVALVAFQQDFARAGQGAVLDGRDIGTVICPQAEVKLFVTASAEVRADRRMRELLDAGQPADPAVILAEVIARDRRDADRSTAPLVTASDATLIDTTDLTPAQALSRAIAVVEARRPA
ncbi:cytidylate kinase [Loktanella fryxellensis]|uniref:Cytidylate kinase n=1 Tax=Loktanella fryxellensis TaxID=245187 RepID=A0A1H8A9Z3_9RHOB|nr:d(CMP) kinase [Loktanella fryxellensis]SEM67383.1 cytidylate kinase [Loktanella fryxellensis]